MVVAEVLWVQIATLGAVDTRHNAVLSEQRHVARSLTRAEP